MIAPLFSVIVPAFNEEAYLPHLLRSIHAARIATGAAPFAIETIVVDNCSTDSTARIAEERGCIVCREAKRCISAVRNRGATVARGAILVFVDADAQLHAQSFRAMEEAVSSHRCIGGVAASALERLSFATGITRLLRLPVASLFKLDTGAAFCTREAFNAIGGYDEALLWGEDLRFLWDLRRHASLRRRGVIRLAKTPTVVSARKYDHYGDWHGLQNAARLLYWAAVNHDRARSFAETYWYGDQRTTGPRSIEGTSLSGVPAPNPALPWTR